MNEFELDAVEPARRERIRRYRSQGGVDRQAGGG